MQKLHRHLETLESTNETAKAWASDESTPAPHGASVSADEQTGGKGRRGRDWVSPKGRGVYLSVVWRPEIAAMQLGQMTIIVALAAAQTIEKLSGLEAQTKWPNDVLLRGRKIGGVLCEAEFASERVEFIVAGVGLNINLRADELPERPIFPATSLQIETGQEYCIEAARELLLQQLQQEYSRYAEGNWNAQRGEFIARCTLLGCPIEVRGERTTYSGVAVGVDRHGLLVVQNAEGLQTVAAGDVSIVTT
jgi:BirA family biotin operon repressor/biotin-[acetyl-CoA-carboxylase] ligase